MSCTSKKKTEFSGLPLLPGTRDWQKHEEKKREFRRRLENAEPVVDDKAPKADLRREINLHEMKVMQTRILMNNRVTKSMVKFEFHLPRGRNVTISITDDDPKIW